MAQGDVPDGNLPLADGDGVAADLGPQYVVSMMLRQGNVQMNLVDVHIPRNITDVEPELLVMLVQYTLLNLIQNPLTSGADDNPLRDFLNEDPDHWTVELNSAGDSFGLSFYPVYNRESDRPVPEDQPSADNISPAESASGSDTDSVVPSRGHDSSEAGRESPAETRKDITRKRKNNDCFENNEPKKRRPAQLSDSDSASDDERSFNNEQPGPSWRNSSEMWPPSTRSSQGVKRKRSSHSSDREEPKRRTENLDELCSAIGSSSSTFSEHRDDVQLENSSEARDSDDSRKERRGKRSKKSLRKKRKSSNQDSDSD